MKIVHKDAFLVVGIKVILKLPELFTKMPKVFKEVENYVTKINFRKNDYLLDINLKREKDLFTRLIGVEVTNMPVIPAHFVGLKIPAASYLYYLHKGEINEIYDAFVLMYDYALKEQLSLDKDEFKIEVHNQKNREYHLYLRLRK